MNCNARLGENGPYRSSVGARLSCAAARQTGLSLRPQNLRDHELKDRGQSVGSLRALERQLLADRESCPLQVKRDDNLSLQLQAG